MVCQYAGIENSFSSLVPGFLIRDNHFPSEEETTLQKDWEKKKKTGEREKSWVSSAWGDSPGAEPTTETGYADRRRRKNLVR